MSSAPTAPSAKTHFKHPSALSRVAALVEAAKADELTKDARSILVHGARYMDIDGWIFPSATRLADDSGYTERSVRKALNDLRAAGIVLSLAPKAWKVAVGDRAKVPKHLPMMLLWPAATRAARVAALGALATEPKALRLTKAPFEDNVRWTITLDKEHGPYATTAVEQFARTEAAAASWPLRRVEDPVEKARPLGEWFWFAAHLPRAAAWARSR